MHEVFPIASGIAVAVLTQRLTAPRLRLAALVVLSLLVGFLASLISGELTLSWGFIWVDALLVLFAAGVTLALTTAWQRRAGLFSGR